MEILNQCWAQSVQRLMGNAVRQPLRSMWSPSPFNVQWLLVLCCCCTHTCTHTHTTDLNQNTLKEANSIWFYISYKPRGLPTGRIWPRVCEREFLSVCIVSDCRRRFTSEVFPCVDDEEEKSKINQTEQIYQTGGFFSSIFLASLCVQGTDKHKYKDVWWCQDASAAAPAWQELMLNISPSFIRSLASSLEDEGIRG